MSARGGHREIWVTAEDGSDPRMLTSMGGVGLSQPRWSPDGSSIIFEREGTIYAIGSGTGIPKPVVVDPAIKAFSPSYSHDGRWIYFASERTGRFEVWRIPPSGSSATLVTKNGGKSPVESPDGQFLFYVKTEGQEASLWCMPPEGGAERRVIDSAMREPGFAVTAGGLCCIRYVDHPDRPAGIDFMNLRSSALKRVLTINMPQRFTGNGFSISPDGRWFLYVLYDFEDDIMQEFENFR